MDLIKPLSKSDLIIITIKNQLFIYFKMCDIMAEERAQWNSRWGFILAMVGSAVGLGNIWRFPNVLYANGGGSFMIPYIVAIFLLGVSFILVEYALGYRFKASISKILYSIKPKFEPIAWLIIAIIFLILTYYIVVVGWDLIYLVLSFTKGWGANPDVFFSSNVLQASDSIAGIFTFVPMVLISVLVLWATIWVITQSDLNSGIEKVSKIVIPLLFIIVVVIVAFSLTLPGASIGYTQIYTPDWSALLNFNVWLAAFGQIVFSLSLGMAIALTYASYLPEGFALADNALLVAFTNSGFEVFNAFGVFSILGFMTFTTGIPFNDLVTEGTGLAFVVFPQVFNQMGAVSYIIGPLFFFSILFAGLTSAIALVEPIASSLTEKFNIKRKRAATLVCLVGLIISLIFTTQAGSMILGVFDMFLNNYALLFTIVLECIIFGWIYKFDNLIETLNQNSHFKVGRIWKFVIRFALPIVIFILWIQGIVNTLFSGDSATYSIMFILLISLIIVPVILAKMPAKNEKYYEVLDEL